MPIAVRGVISYTLTDAELELGRDLRRKYNTTDWGFCSYEEWETLENEIRTTLGIPIISGGGAPITNYMELFDDA